MWEYNGGWEWKKNTFALPPVSLGQWAWDREMKSELGQWAKREMKGIWVSECESRGLEREREREGRRRMRGREKQRVWDTALGFFSLNKLQNGEFCRIFSLFFNTYFGPFRPVSVCFGPNRKRKGKKINKKERLATPIFQNFLWSWELIRCHAHERWCYCYYYYYYYLSTSLMWYFMIGCKPIVMDYSFECNLIFFLYFYIF